MADWRPNQPLAPQLAIALCIAILKAIQEQTHG
jgi:hypothetical protein